MAEMKDLVKEAEDINGKAVKEMEVDLRDAAEKAWGITVGATDARPVFLWGNCEPGELIKKKIVETNEYIEDVKNSSNALNDD